MNTYRVYVLNTAVALAPTVAIAYIRAEKYGPAWQLARKALSENTGKLFNDPECSKPAKLGIGDDITVSKIVDIKPRNVKLDKSALQAILADPTATAEAKLAAMKLALV